MISTVLTIIGLAGLEDDLATWATWLEPIAPYLDSPLARWLFVIVGLAGIAAASLWRRPAPAQGEPDGRGVAAIEPPVPVESEPIERQMVEIDFGYINKIYADYTTAQASKLIADYIGKWTQVSGVLLDVIRLSNGSVFASFSRVEKYELPWIYMTFTDKEWADRLPLLQRGRPLTVLGQIEKLMANELFLDHCELVSSE